MAVTGEEYELHGLVLAAGGSQRLGQPKQLLQVDNETLLHRACRQALVVCDEVTVVLGAAAAEIGQAISDLPLGRLINPDWQSGMASSIHAGITALPVTADGVLILPCDQPALTATDLQRLAASWRVQSDRIVAAAYDGIRGVPVIWPRDRFADLLGLSGDRGARELLNADAAQVVSVDMPAAALDIDTPAVARAQGLL